MSVSGCAISKSLNGEDDTEVISVTYNAQNLEIVVATANHSRTVTFNQPGGFRVLDEGDLLEFWPTFSTSSGWLFEIYQDGWKSLESTRWGFTSGEHCCKREFLIVGMNACVSVLCFDAPELIE